MMLLAGVQRDGKALSTALMIYVLGVIFGAASSEFEAKFTADSLSADTGTWANVGTLGSSLDITALTGTVQVESTTAGGSVQSLCFDNTQTSELTNIAYDIDYGVRPDLTLSAWFRPDEFTSYDWILGNDDGGYDRAIVIYDPRYGGLAAAVGNTYSSTLGQLTLGEWVHIVVTYSSSGVATVYKNGGDLAGGSQQTVSTGQHSSSSVSTMGLNGVQWSTYKSVGCFAQFQMTDRVVSPEEVAVMYDDFDQSMNRLPTEEPSADPTAMPTFVPTATPHKDCSVLHIDDFLRDCSSEFDGHNSKIDQLESDIAALQVQLQQMEDQLDEMGDFP